MSLLFHIMYAAVAFILQAMVFTRLPIMGVKPLILPVAVAVAAVYEGSARGAAVGLVCGMLCDLATNQPMIEFTLLLTLLGLAIGILSETMLTRGFPSCIVCSAVVLVICAFVQAFDLLFFDKVSFWPIGRTALIQTGYSLLFCLPAYWMARPISRISRG